ncbi:dihydroorotate dehydrogenase electron transfer subunit [Bacillus sp. 1NLA3E]|uniref:dihydroorotate dehydrogenase electron transfer subunit n=1 Tax=Bacillus sp. 1NLA3E TaxID=666686 RepID=UPI000247E582|nr:dihydroorotate dehydrogenase electron transfer subunit [Bacillus sp. 1NLA3E]AGK53015.1 dihydroorotate dehydrogenase electron transfer subunit [Bacillus sp. 1NLA3E]
MINKEQCIVIDQQEIAASVYELTLQGDITREMGDPGQFVHLKVSNGLDPLLRRPISISSIDKENKQFTMIYRSEGRGTTLLSEKIAGDSVDVLGPLGHGFPVAETNVGETALLVGGGIGVPPLYELSRQLVSRGIKVIHILGFQTENVVFYEKMFTELGTTYVATVDGSYGHQGFVTDVIVKEGLDFNTLYACGPTPMLKALEANFPNKKVFLSLEERMGCGIGACFACVCHTGEDPTGHSYKKVCTDGPVFRAGEVVI